ncbi:hypothetical protein ACFONJ_02335 [Chryseobacterium tructae]|uniref:Uncharacterized protein n=2 Tax=Chryseobacterium tructae TaxID=1037380 RepID=A0ABV7XRM6_9FLAO
MPNTPTPKIYYPRLSDLITLDQIPEPLGFIKTLSQDVFSKIYYKNYQVSTSELGSSAFHSLSIVTKEQVGFNLPFGLKFVLNRDAQNNAISSFPITVQYNWPVIAYFSQFNLGNFSFSPKEIYRILLVSLNLSEDKVINEILNVFVSTPGGDSIKKFVDDINANLGTNLSSPIPYPTSENKIRELINSINLSYGEGAAFAAFATYILSNANVNTTKNNLKLFFKNILPADIDQYLLDIITPKALVTLETTASIEFPRNILKPWKKVGDVLTPETDLNKKTAFEFAKALFYADTTEGIGYNLDIAGTLNPSYSEIGNTGLLIQIERLKLDLSKTKNIPEADAYGYSPDFTGVYARAVSVTLPPKWFTNADNPAGNTSTTLRLGGYDMLIGTGGVSGTIMLESVPVANPGTSFEYFNDKFSFNYPIGLYTKDPVTQESQTLTLNNYQELKNALQQINNTNNGSTAPYEFKFPLSLKPNGLSTSLTFNNPSAYQTYLSGLNNNLLWKKVGGENGFKVGFKSFDITFKQNSVVSSNIEGRLFIPKFTDSQGQPANIDVKGHIDGNGDFSLTASAVPPFDPTLTLPGVFKLHLKSVELGKEGDRFYIGASADVEFLGTFGALLKGQTLSISTLRIYSDGHIDFRVNGGNLILPEPIKIPIGPVEVSVTAIHFGSHERMKDGKMRKYNYFGFDGGVSIGLAGLDARGDGIKYYYTIDDDIKNCEPGGDETQCKPHDSYLHIQTIHVDMIIPANSSDPSVSIKGWLSVPEPGEFQEYQGGVSLKVKNPRIAGGVEMRLAPKYPAFLIDANIELPNPIALGPVSIYGFRGLLGYRYVAEKEAIGMTSQNTWYQYYTAPERGVNVKKFNRPDKTEHYSFPFSLGVGAIIGDTMAAGTIISANAMLLLSLPSMVMIDARMKLLSSRVKFADDPPFFAFFIFGDSSLEFGFGADYKFPEKTGDVIKLYAEIQAGFFFNNPSAWYINFGTQQNPITAKLLKDLFTLKAFLMISGKGIQAGARGEFRFDRRFGPIKVFVLAYLELGGKISFQKPQMGAYLEAGLTIDVDVVIIRVYLAVTILLAVESPRPFLIYGAFTLAFKVKILFFKISFSVKLELKWEFNKDVDRDPINPFIDTLSQNPNFAKGIAPPDQADSLVKGISMLTNETFDLERRLISELDGLTPASIKKVIPLDTYIDIKSTKGLLPTASSNAIGGFTNPASNYNDMIPPEKNMKGLELRQVKHQYTLDNIEIKAYTGAGWVDYEPFRAMDPNNPHLNNTPLKVGQWQKKDNQYNAIRLLGTTPFSYTEQGNPGWFTPEQYGILPSTLFCEGQHIEHSISDFLDKPLNTQYYASSSNFFQSKGASYQISGDNLYTVNPDGSIAMNGDFAKVSDEVNVHNFMKSLEFPNRTPLTIMLPASAVDIELLLSTYSTGLNIKFYAPIIDDHQSLVQYRIVDDRNVSRDELTEPVKFNVDALDAASKIVITPEITDMVQINLILEQMAALMNEGYQIALQQGGFISGVVQPSDPALYDQLQNKLEKLQSRGCEGFSQQKFEEACVLYPALVGIYNNNFIMTDDFNLHSDEELLALYANFIRENLQAGVYDEVLNKINYFNIPLDLLKANAQKYEDLLKDLHDHLGWGTDEEMISRFELLKAKMKQILSFLETINLCKDASVCNLSAALAYQPHFDLNNNFSPFMETFEQFIQDNPWKASLKETLNRQLATLQQIIDFGYVGYEAMFAQYCQELISLLKGLGNCNDHKKCLTLFHEVKWMSVENYQYNVHIPGQPAIAEDTGAVVNAITNFIQPIWRPDTAYYVKFQLKDTVDNGFKIEPYEYAYTFKTAGPLGFFHLDKDATYGEIPIKDSPNVIEDTIGVIRDPNGNVIDSKLTPHPDLYPHTSLRAYIDYQRSYPNADGNIVNAKPLFYDDKTTQIFLYFTSRYAAKLLSGWDSYNGMSRLGGTMKILIKDPVEGVEVINPPHLDATEQTIEGTFVEIPQTIEAWAQESNPAIPTALNQYIQMLNNGDHCTGNVTLTTPKSLYRLVTPKKLKPQKLYTAQVMNFYWGKDEVSLSNITEEIKQKYGKEVHKFVFQTSRYKDFREQVRSYLKEYKDENNSLQFKPAVYTIKKAIDADKIAAAYNVIQNLSTPLGDAIANQYQHPFDRVFQGLFNISPLEDATTTEFNKIIDTNTGKVIAILIRNPEPFNHPKIPLEKLTRTKESGMIEVIANPFGGIKDEISSNINTKFTFLYSKDYSQAILMKGTQGIREITLDFQFIYKIWDDSVSDYVISTVATANEIQIN